jgi:hypothetical protein
MPQPCQQVSFTVEAGAELLVPTDRGVQQLQRVEAR